MGEHEGSPLHAKQNNVGADLRVCPEKEHAVLWANTQVRYIKDVQHLFPPYCASPPQEGIKGCVPYT